MFDIEYRGGNAVNISTKNRKLQIDANIELLGLKQQKVDGSVQIATEPRFVVPSEESLILEGPGEYEVEPFSITGVATKRMIDADQDTGSTLYRIEIGDVRLAVVGNTVADLNDEQLETLGVVDILIVPIGGGGYTLDATDAIKLIRQIEPRAVVPVHYADSQVKYEVPQEPIDRFVNELGTQVEVTSKLKIKGSSSLPPALTVYQINRI